MERERRRAAVVLGIESTPPHKIIFVERGAHLRHHAGQIGLPGGGEDPSDNGNLVETALRELDEEVGISRDRVTIIGQLPELQPRVSAFDVTPFVAIIEPGPLRIDTSELDGAFAVPLETVLREIYEGSVNVGSFRVQSWLLDVDDDRRIWGLTGRILREFAVAWKDRQSGLKAAVRAKLRHGSPP